VITMNNVLTLKTPNHSYVVIPVPKASSSHTLKLSTLNQCYVAYQKAESVVHTPYVLQLNSEIVGLASSISDNFKKLLMSNNIVLKEWVGTKEVTEELPDELLIIELT
jgi:hypothetical protein